MTKMKESGIDWIGQIPEEWRVRPIKHIVETPVTDGPHETPVLYETGIPFLSAEAVKDGVLDFNFKRGYISLKDHDRFKKKISPKKDDIFIVKSGATTGNVGIVNTDEIFDIWSPLALIRCNKTLAIQKYIYFYLLSTLFKSQVEFNWSFGTQQNIGMGVIERIKVILPPVSEQQKIVEVLDKKTAQLDKAKALLEEQIQKLKDYRASLIYETVTKGLDKTVPMKDSGIDWIGQVPQGWGVSRLKYYFDIYAGGDIDERNTVEEYSESHPYPVLSNSLENEGVLGYTNKYRFKKNCVTVTGRGDVGKAVYRNINFYPVVRLLVCVPKSQVDCRFVTYWINSAIIEKNQTAVSQLTIQMLGELLFVNVPFLVQKNIADFLDKKTVQIDKLIQIKNQQIDNINKQRQTLIYDYVTGKKRV
ncbi:restriction endonuclease subunit S [Streptococcus sp. HMSC057G03]|mgnify:CR=1 FL=1|uniref:restriction endonuclease subunit S n=1 Tax=Streptococcus sp. HMSC057G03 TaxID=1715165 RepID=UPI0008A41BEA|nr:restriction endonuclease subunit S [Streptococcus sp. HMSC057G03]OFN91334.1 type I restriction endonuclease subunit S [Streptococcus sp. HMSC057G03]